MSPRVKYGWYISAKRTVVSGDDAACKQQGLPPQSHCSSGLTSEDDPEEEMSEAAPRIASTDRDMQL